MQKKGIRVLSIFDGISCARVALDRLGYKDVTYYASEVDKYAIQIAQKNWPGTVQVGSVVGLDGTQFKDIDLMIGGSPCQDLSIAKTNRKGLDGERSGLFWEYVRILNEVKPKYFVLENVASMPKEAKDLITKTLGVEPIMIDAALVSAQRRKRLFWVGRLVGNKYEQVVIPQPEDRGILLKDILEDGDTVINPKLRNFKGDTEKSMTITATAYKEPPLVLKTKSNTTGQTKESLIAHVPKIINIPQSQRVYGIGGKSVTLSANGGGGGIALTERRTEEAKKLRSEHMKKTGKDFSPRRAKELVAREDGKANTITTGQTKESLIAHPNLGIRKLTTIECERLQSLPDNYTEGVSNTQRYKACGNAFNVEVVRHILSFI